MQIRYEVLRAFHLDGLTAAQIAEKFSLSPLSVYSLTRDHKNSSPSDFFLPLKKGPKTRRDKTLAVKDQIIQLRKQNFSIEQIQEELLRRGARLSIYTISEILQEEGFTRLFRRTRKEMLETVAAREHPQKTDIALFAEAPFAKTQFGGVFLAIPLLLNLDAPGLVESIPFYGSGMIPKLQYFLSFLALKLIGKERLCHVDDLSFDYGLGCFAGLNVLPKSTAVTQYSYRNPAELPQQLGAGFVSRLSEKGLLPGKFINLDFHAIPHYGDESRLDKNWIPTRGKSMKSVLSFFAQDLDTTYLCYANSDIQSDEINDEVLRFVKHYTKTTGRRPECLVFDSKLTTYANVWKLHDEEKIHFITLRRRGPALLRQAAAATDWKNITLTNIDRKYRRLRAHSHTIRLKDYHAPLRQIIVTGTGRETPMFLITDDFDLSEKSLITIYSHRWRIENSIQENVDFFNLNALSSPVVVKVDYDITLTLIANSLFKILASNLRRFEKSKPKKIYRNFIEIPAVININNDDVVVNFNKKSYNPLLMDYAKKMGNIRVPWFENRYLRFSFD